MNHPMRIPSAALMAWLTLVCLNLAGCGDGGADGLPREAVSGTVTLDGQPLPEGAIQMLPAGTKEGIAGGAVIKDGKYAIERDKGLLPGSYRVVINSGQAAGAAPANEPPGPIKAADVPKDLVPRQYNAETTLTADVKPGTPNTFAFDLKSK